MALLDTYVGINTAHLAQDDYRRALALANHLKARGLVDLLDGDVDPKSATRNQTRPWKQADSAEAMAKLCWATGADPAERFAGLKAWCREHGLREEADYYARAEALADPGLQP